MGKQQYELTDETIELKGHTLHRIRALRSIAAEKHELGGFIEYDEYDRRVIFGSAQPSACATVADQKLPEEPDSGESEPKDPAKPTE